ncbi:Glucose-methanol-choline oxidoreductase C-terminal [Penicillium samsonianum]|uniref:Glucose-methanol-choline oxidoreductase C-terminal n=1 Tax=Penicillium samsonianum TaxID=1882272 RepID=UPI002547CDFA|nr:Glucose-methanol-choline oxidoreductase C-terminal [Penicillium samsonianum]KAJ6150011.1 Glucose-methanol-choline oxidoreductase C-terminal [Penicillium samsonianum]
MPVQDNARFDFIVVGGGTAGNVVAGRLAENPNAKILIVEAGVANSIDIEEIRTPSEAMQLRNSQYDWAYKTTMIKRDDYERVEKPNTRGKALGGSSSLNYFTWAPGSKGTFDMWEEYGGKEWTWDPLVPYLRKSATYHDDAKAYAPELKNIGGNGPIDISHSELIPEMQPFRDLLTTAWKASGQPIRENIFDGEMVGLTYSVNSIYKGRRSGSFLCVTNKPNITILAEVHSKKLIIDNADKTCKGVTVITGSGQELNLYATREVIVSQGVFESPKLLMLSGIGPSAELKKHGIPVILDNAHVGQHLLDHPGVPFVLRVKDGFGMDDYVLRQGTPHNNKAIQAYQNNHGGPLGSGFLEMVGFPRIDKYLEKDPQYRAAKASNDNKDPFCPYGQPHFELDFVCLFGSAFQWHYPTPNKGNYMTVMVDLVRPVSEPGEVTLNSADPLQQPNINLNYFNNDLDIIAIREGIRYSYDVLNGPGFKDIIEGEYPWEMPLHDDNLMKRAVLDRSQTSFHPCGTARLSKNIQQGVVDPNLKVHGIKNLRVIDASVIPVIPDCRIQNSVYMIGEKGADAIKRDHTDFYK